MADFVISKWNGEVHTSIEYHKRRQRPEQLAREKFREVIPLSDDEIQRAGIKLVSKIYAKQIEAIKAQSPEET